MTRSSCHWPLACLAGVGALLAGCVASTPLKPEEIAAGTGQAALAPTAEESRLWVQAEEFDAALKKSDALYPNDAATRYVQGLMDKLYPEFAAKIHVGIVRSPEFNAFALPNGSVYVNTGLLAKLDNEAQLATVLAHEATHFLHRHSLNQARNVKSMSVFAMGVALAGIPLAGDLIAISSIYGYSRDLEREADSNGYERLQRAGYDVRESVAVFESMLKEVKALDIDQPVFFSSHPRLQERIDSFKALSAKAPAGGFIGHDEYVQAMREVYVIDLETQMRLASYRSLIYLLEDPGRREHYPSHADYFLGEAYRQRDEKDDRAKAEAAFRKALAAAPDYAPTYRALGVLLYQQKRNTEARPLLQQYLQRAPGAADRGYVDQYLSNMK
jgi:beta-barrel assembly-enhancing protease